MGAGTMFAQTINFEAQCPGGSQGTGACSSLFSNVGNAQTLVVSTSVGNVTFQGGALLDNTTNLPADETAIYGTAGNATPLGITGLGTGFTNPITVTFAQPVHNFFLTILNGNTQTVNYQVSDNAGNSSTFAVAPNLSSGSNVIGFPASGTVITIAALTGQSSNGGITWDFFIDNVNFNQALPNGLNPISSTSGTAAVPAVSPAAGVILALGLAAIGLWGLKMKKPGHRALMLLAALLLVPAASYSADGVLGVKGVWKLTLHQSTVTLTIDKQNGSQFSGTISGDRLGGRVSGEVRGLTLVFDRTPASGAWPADDTGLQKQSFKLDLVPACGGCAMVVRGAWSGYGQTDASKSAAGLAASAERIR
jgi:hypothetical protein